MTKFGELCETKKEKLLFHVFFLRSLTYHPFILWSLQNYHMFKNLSFVKTLLEQDGTAYLGRNASSLHKINKVIAIDRNLSAVGRFAFGVAHGPVSRNQNAPI